MRITIVDQCNTPPWHAAHDAISAVLVRPNHWRMSFESDGTVFDEYFTADVFDLIREMVSPLC